jgi:hypothetical protein
VKATKLRFHGAAAAVNGERIIITSKDPDMNIAEMRREPTVETLRAGTIDMKLEVVVIPVSDDTSFTPELKFARVVA